MRRSLFIQGPISVAFISAQIRKHQFKTDIGANQIFLGQVRADQTTNGLVTGIEYTAYEQMALDVMEEIRASLFEKYPIRCIHVYHSLGLVKPGGCSLFIYVSAAHSEAAFFACQELLSKVKKQLPIWGKEVMDKQQYQWKVNTMTESI